MQLSALITVLTASALTTAGPIGIKSSPYDASRMAPQEIGESSEAPWQGHDEHNAGGADSKAPLKARGISPYLDPWSRKNNPLVGFPLGTVRSRSVDPNGPQFDRAPGGIQVTPQLQGAPVTNDPSSNPNEGYPELSNPGSSTGAGGQVFGRRGSRHSLPDDIRQQLEDIKAAQEMQNAPLDTNPSITNSNSPSMGQPLVGSHLSNREPQGSTTNVNPISNSGGSDTSSDAPPPLIDPTYPSVDRNPPPEPDASYPSVDQSPPPAEYPAYPVVQQKRQAVTDKATKVQPAPFPTQKGTVVNPEPVVTQKGPGTNPDPALTQKQTYVEPSPAPTQAEPYVTDAYYPWATAPVWKRSIPTHHPSMKSQVDDELEQTKQPAPTPVPNPTTNPQPSATPNCRYTSEANCRAYDPQCQACFQDPVAFARHCQACREICGPCV